MRDRHLRHLPRADHAGRRRTSTGSEAPGFARLKRDKGDVLMCQARPTCDCVLRVAAKVAARPDCDTLPQHRTARIEVVRKLTPT